MQPSRRNVLAGAATATAAAALGTSANAPSFAAAPPINKQAAGYYRYKVGTFEVTAVTDGMRTDPSIPDTYVRNAKKEDVIAALAAAHLETDKLRPPFNPFVVNTGSKLVVVDCGLGPALFEQSKGAIGQFHTNLAAAGIDRNDVDTVIISHFHADHINGLLTADSKPAFPKAEIMVPAPEWSYWKDDGNMSRAPEALKGGFNNVRRVFGALGDKVTQFEAGKEIMPGITALASHGHTPGHTSFVISSGSSRLLAQADLTAHVAVLFVRNPSWHPAFDMDGPMAEQVRRKLYDMAIAEKMPVLGFHFPFPSLGFIEKDGAGYRLVPVAWNPVL